MSTDHEHLRAVLLRWVEHACTSDLTWEQMADLFVQVVDAVRPLPRSQPLGEAWLRDIESLLEEPGDWTHEAVSNVFQRLLTHIRFQDGVIADQREDSRDVTGRTLWERAYAAGWSAALTARDRGEDVA